MVVIVVSVVSVVVVVGTVMMFTVVRLQYGMRAMHDAGRSHSRSEDGGKDKGGGDFHDV